MDLKYFYKLGFQQFLTKIGLSNINTLKNKMDTYKDNFSKDKPVNYKKPDAANMTETRKAYIA